MTGKYFHLAGVISLAGIRTDFGMPWHPSMMPLAPNFTMFEKSIMECALAGCETIWVVCNEDTTPLVRYRVGDWVPDPVWASRFLSPNHYDLKKEIPIFYVPVHPDDLGRRDGLAWSILSGAKRASTVSKVISKWTTPHKFFVSFPYGVTELEVFRENRKLFSSDVDVSLNYNGATVIDNEYLSFTFGHDKLDALIKNFKRKNTGMFVQNKKLPLQERYSGRYFTLEETFEDFDMNKFNQIVVKKYYRIDSWKGYEDYISSGISEMFCGQPTIRYNEFNRIPQEGQ